jgi:hypothetical protein
MSMGAPPSDSTAWPLLVTSCPSGEISNTPLRV